MDKKRIALLRLLLVATLGAGCCWAIKASRGFFGSAGGGGSSFDDGSHGQDDTFMSGPEGEEFTAEETNDDDFGFDAGTDSLGLAGGFGSSDSDGTSPQSEVAFSEESSNAAAFDPAYHTHSTNVYDQHTLGAKEEEYVDHHPVSYYEKKKQEKEAVAADATDTMPE